jgi:hypothetical protein
MNCKLFCFAIFVALSFGATNQIAWSQSPSEKSECTTQVKVLELKDYQFTGTSFLDDRPDLSFKEAEATTQYRKWSEDAVGNVNTLLPVGARLCEVKFKLIFQAEIKSPDGKQRQSVPISMLESYQEPKTHSVRLGMLEMKNDEATFKDVVAHEYAHLVFENTSRTAGTTKETDEVIPFWPKPVYEGLADLVSSFAMNTTQLGSKRVWGARDLNEFSTVDEAKRSKAEIVSKARKAFREYGLIPKYAIYQDWLNRIDHFIKASGGVDPYAEGVWLAGALHKKADNIQQQKKMIQVLVSRAKAGTPTTDAKSFYDSIVKALSD